MTKKHFIALADHIRTSNSLRNNAGLPLMFDTATVESLANFCKAQNHGFNRERWLDYIAGKCGSNGGTIKTHPRTGMATDPADTLIHA